MRASILIGIAAVISAGVSLIVLGAGGSSFSAGLSAGPVILPRVADRPVLVTEHDGVRLWKVRDLTHGGSAWIYFASPATRPTVVGEAGDRVPSAIDGR